MERSSDEAKQIDAAKQFSDERLAPNAEAWERDGRVPKEVQREAAQAGLTLLFVDPPHGPGRVGLPVAGQIGEALAAGCLPAGLPLIAHNYVAWALIDSGRKDLIARYLPAMRAGEILGTFCLTEPQSGSDAAGIQTVARRTSDGFVLNGEKAWIMRAESADFFGVYAQTEPGASSRGIAMFLVDADAPGIQRETYELFAGNAFEMGGFRLENVAVEESALLVPPGQGLRNALRAIDVARGTVASMCCGLLARGLEEAVEVTSKRRAFGQTLSEFQGIQWMLAEAATDLEAARALSQRALHAIDADDGTGSVLAAHAKKFAARVAMTRLSDCMQVMGANGAKSETAASRHLGYAKLAQYLDGTSEIQNVVISRALYRS